MSKQTSPKRKNGSKKHIKHHQSPKKINYAFIDNENVNISVIKQGWKIDRTKFRKMLKKERNVEVAYMFMGYLPEYQEMYTFFQNIGYTLIFKPVNTSAHVPNKGNVDAELVLQAMIDIATYDNAIIVTGDGDFSCLVRYLEQQNKLGTVIVPNQKRYSNLLDDAAKGKLISLTRRKRSLQYVPSKKESTDTSYYDRFYD